MHHMLYQMWLMKMKELEQEWQIEISYLWLKSEIIPIIVNMENWVNNIQNFLLPKDLKNINL